MKQSVLHATLFIDKYYSINNEHSRYIYFVEDFILQINFKRKRKVNKSEIASKATNLNPRKRIRTKIPEANQRVKELRGKIRARSPEDA